MFDDTETLTICKYKIGGKFCFHVMDKFDEPDEPARLDRMIAWSSTMAELKGDAYEELWIKTCPIFATR